MVQIAYFVWGACRFFPQGLKPLYLVQSSRSAQGLSNDRSHRLLSRLVYELQPFYVLLIGSSSPGFEPLTFLAFLTDASTACYLMATQAHEESRTRTYLLFTSRKLELMSLEKRCHVAGSNLPPSRVLGPKSNALPRRHRGRHVPYLLMRLVMSNHFLLLSRKELPMLGSNP